MDVDTLISQKLVHEIHTSERKSFRACRRRWDWLFRESYYPKTTAKPLEFGVAFHKAMETFYNPVTWTWDREVIAQQAILDFVAVCEEQKAKAIENSGHLYLENEQEDDYAERVELGKGMLTYFFTKVAPYEDKGWTPVKVELGFMIPIPNPETGEDLIWCACSNCVEKWTKQYGTPPQDWQGLPVVYAGRLDVLAQDANGNYWIIDWKTAAAIRDDKEFLYLDDQIGSYVWALIRLGLPVKGFIYHEQRKAFPIEPKENKSRRLGRLFSVSKSEPYEYNLYLATIKERDKDAYEAGLYDEMLEYLRNEGSTFFSRTQVAKSQDEIDEIERNIGYEALDMIDTNIRIYPSPGRFGCNFCAFRQPCMEKNAKGDYQYALDTMFEQREHYYVRQDASTESKGGE